MNRERYKKYLLLGLILTSIIQVGILWDINSHGFPFNFFRAIQNKVAPVSMSVKKELFSPKRIMVTTGAYQSNWIINKDGDTQEIYKDLWEDAQIYIKNLITGTDIEAMEATDEKWSDIVLRKSVGIEFDTPLSQDMIGYLLNDIKVKNPTGPEFVKIVISPWDNINYSSNTIYLLDSSMHVYKYSVSMAKVNLSKEMYNSIIDKLKNLENEDSIRNYMVFSETKIKAPLPIRQDMLIAGYGNKYDKLSMINMSIPENYKVAAGDKLSEIEYKLRGLLGENSDSYDISKDYKGIVVLKNLENIYRVYPSGILEYKKAGNIYSNKGSKNQAFKNAITVIEKLGIKPNNVSLHLSGIDELKDRYKFTFDYSISNLPIYFELGTFGKENQDIQNAIVIECNNEGVLSCWWVIRNIDQAKDKRFAYNVNFADILDNTFKEYPDIKHNKNISIQDIKVGYKLTSGNSTLKVDPMGLIIDSNNKIYDVKLSAKKGD